MLGPTAKNSSPSSWSFVPLRVTKEVGAERERLDELVTVKTLEGNETQSLQGVLVSALDVRLAYMIAYSGQDRAGEASLTSRKPWRTKLCTVSSYVGSLSEASAWL